MTQERYEKLRSINSQFPPESNSIHFSTLYFLVMLNHIILTNLVVSLVACGEDVAKYDINGVTPEMIDVAVSRLLPLLSSIFLLSSSLL